MARRKIAAIQERHKQISLLIKEHGKTTVKQLCDRFGVSVVTIRNDLAMLEDNGTIIRTHGGAIAAQKKEIELPLPFDMREEKNFAAKQAIGKAAADMVNDGEVIFIDGRTTASEMRHYLKQKKDVTIITPSIVVTYWLAATSNLNIYILNGFFNRDSYSATGVPSLEFSSQWNLSKAFFGASGFTFQEGFSDPHIGFVEQKKIIMQKARRKIALVDSSKWGTISLATYARPQDIDLIITDNQISQGDLKNAMDAGIDVHVVNK